MAVSGVMFGISLFVFTLSRVTEALGIGAVTPLFPKMPPWILSFVGTMHMLVFLPIFISGIYYLKPPGAIGQSPRLIKNGIYHYLRNPFYAGISFTLTGLGLILDHMGIFLTGLVWLTICFVQCKREEKQLSEKFGQEYLSYKKETPMFIPDFHQMVSDFFHIPKIKKYSKPK